MDYDVIVAGAGPTGLMLAGELGMRGISTLVLERDTEPDPTVKAGAINVPTIEALRRRGFEERLREYHDQMLSRMLPMFAREDEPDPTLEDVRSWTKTIGGHFGGLFAIDPSQVPADDRYADVPSGKGGWMVTQQQLEAELADWVTGLGIEVRRGSELIGFTEQASGIEVGCANGDRIEARYLVGADGGRSLVRKLAGFEFPGTEPTLTGHQAIVDMDHPEQLPKSWNRMEHGMLVHGPGPGRILTVEFDGPPADRDAPITTAELQESLRRVSGTDIVITAVHSATQFTDNARQATDYRRGRVFLAGDAAHVHSPFGGQGLNLGIGDAVNLGWKLAAALHGTAPEGLLESYTSERHPVGARILEITRAQIAMMRPGPQVSALRGLLTELMSTVDGNTYFVNLMSGRAHHYALPGSHPLVGTQLPAARIEDDITPLRSGTGSLFGAEVPHGWADRVTPAPAAAELPAMLARPDGYVAWAGEEPDTELETALRAWFGEPTSP
ncbi:FAD-dependent monooxygenase [Sciscionella marina]|uniref:FAD-dependent monooxygenase n=1 Tax=Sciscionella marina TaxID=508770 RepID=UPI00037D21BD|nr:FAD-dependent monooxygenase [Sciscionella marina]